jgi:hypothetical protein
MRVTIPHRPRVEPIYTTDVPDDDRYPIRTAVERAYLAGADLAHRWLDRRMAGGVTNSDERGLTIPSGIANLG